jgi:hypothetical protein
MVALAGATVAAAVGKTISVALPAPQALNTKTKENMIGKNLFITFSF